ncbi:MAG: ABC transporter permease [Acidobacteria bacterium]|nr:ABC transporter permease [Acidobacteriota bacterium]
MVSTRYAARSVGRNLRRTVLSIVGVAIGCLLALFMESLNRGRGELFARAGSASGLGHVRVVPAGWRGRRDPRLRLADWRADLAAAQAMSGVASVTARARAQVLLAVGTHVVPVELTGVQPDIEPRTFRYVQTIGRGRYLRADDGGALVAGRAIADRLSADLDDEIVATTVGPGGEIQSALFRLVGIVSTGSDDTDLAVCQVVLEDLQRLTGFAGAGEVSIVLNDYREIDRVRARLAGSVAAADEVMTLSELAPDIEGHFKQDAAMTRFVSGIILLIVLLGVASAQLAAVLERRREFAVLAALGMNGPRMVWLIVQEALMLGGGGAVLAVAAGVPLVWKLARSGLDFSRYLGGTYAFQGVLFDPVIYGDFGWWIVVYVSAVAMGATILASLYPAWYAARTDPAVALRVAQ